MKPVTQKQVKEAAQKSKRAAVKISIEKYIYLIICSIDKLKKLPDDFLYGCYCGLCKRYIKEGKNCPLKKNCEGMCIDEWGKMKRAYDIIIANSEIFLKDKSYYYNKFLFNAIQILRKLIDIKGKI